MDRKPTTVDSDIYTVLNAAIDHDPDAQLAASYAMRIGGEFAKATLKRDRPRQKGKLWASDIGKPCLRQHHYNFNMPEAGEPLMGHTRFKFLYGNILEEAVLYMAEEAGHEVTDQQHRVEVDVEREDGLDWQITGRLDARLDGHIIDVKSTSSFGYKRYKDGIDANNDSFGYLWQLGVYKEWSGLPSKGEGFLWVDKQNGHVKYTPCVTPDKEQILERARNIADAVEQETASNVPRAYSPEPYGKSGNQCLPTPCSYCPFKRECWKDSNSGAGLRSFAYNHGPVHFTTIVREPRCPEINYEQ